MYKARKHIIYQRTKVTRDGWEKKYSILFAAILNRQFRELAGRIDVTNYRNEQLINNITKEPIEKAFVSLYKNVGVVFARDITRQLKSENQSLLLKQSNEDDWQAYMEAYVKAKAGSRITSIAQSSREQALKIIRETLDESNSEGWGADETAREMRRALMTDGVEINQWRALRIARTEIVTASNQGSMKGARDLDMPLNKYWIPTYDARTRDTHLPMEEQNPKTMDEKFQVGDYEMDAPGDPDAGPEEVINCRCAIAFELIQE